MLIPLFFIYGLLLLVSHTLCQTTNELDPDNLTNIAILLDCSRSPYNVRHQSNVMLLAESLVEYGGFLEENVMIFTANDQNSLQFHVVTSNLNSGKEENSSSYLDYRPISQIYYFNTIISGNDASSSKNDENIKSVIYRKQTFSGAEITPNFILDFIGTGKFLNFAKFTSSINPSKGAKGVRLLLYIAGHGDTNIIKVGDLYSIHSHDIARSLNIAHKNGFIDEICVVVDSCKSGTIIKNINSHLSAKTKVSGSNKSESTNTTMLRYIGISSSSEVGKSISAFHHPLTAVSLIDRFTLKLAGYIKNRAWDSFTKENNVENFKHLFPEKDLQSEITISKNFDVKNIWNFFHVK